MDTPTLSWVDVKFNSFDEDEMVLLKLFHEKCIQIAESQFIQRGEFNASFTIHVDKIKGEINTSLHMPEEADIRSILVLVRQITLQNEDTNILIERILNILKYRSANERTKLYIQNLTRKYKDRSSEPCCKLRGRYGEYNEMEVFDLWVNGYFFHNDNDKRKKLDDLMEWPPMKAAAKDILIKIVIDSCNWASSIDAILINTILQEDES